MANISTVKVGGTSYNIDAVTVNGHTVKKDVPSDAVFTDNNTTYTAASSSTAVGTAAVTGTSTAYARADHVHNITKATITTALGYTPPSSAGASVGSVTPAEVATAAVVGTSTVAARADHKHNITSDTIASVLGYYPANSNIFDDAIRNSDIADAGADGLIYGNVFVENSLYGSNTFQSTMDNDNIVVGQHDVSTMIAAALPSSDLMKYVGPTTTLSDGTRLEDIGYPNGVIVINDLEAALPMWRTESGFTNSTWLDDAYDEKDKYLTNNNIFVGSGLAKTIDGAGKVTISKQNGDIHYCTSSATATTTAKTATVSGSIFNLVKGTRVSIYFSNANTVAGKITLNVNSKGAKDVYVNGAVTSATNCLPWEAKTTMDFVYNGTYWYFVGSSAGAIYTGTVTPAQARIWIQE